MSGAGYFIKGFSLINTKGIRRFVLIPLTVNIILFGAAFYYLFSQISQYINEVISWLPDILSWVDFLLWPLAVVLILVSSSFIFSAIANWIAAPFNGLLAERIEAHLTGEVLPGSLADAFKDLPRIFGREWTKLKYYIPRAIVFLAVFFLLPVIGQVIWFLFSAWMMSVQYCDYPFDNHKVGFNEMRNELLRHRGKCFSFGIAVLVFAMIPLVNLVVMPVAICGATAMWVDHFRKDYKLQ